MRKEFTIMKQLLAILLTASMLLGITTTASAEQSTRQADINDALDILKHLAGIQQLCESWQPYLNITDGDININDALGVLKGLADIEHPVELPKEIPECEGCCEGVPFVIYRGCYELPVDVPFAPIVEIIIGLVDLYDDDREHPNAVLVRVDRNRQVIEYYSIIDLPAASFGIGIGGVNPSSGGTTSLERPVPEQDVTLFMVNDLNWAFSLGVPDGVNAGQLLATQWYSGTGVLSILNFSYHPHPPEGWTLPVIEPTTDISMLPTVDPFASIR
jgi:hypothetical protein